MSFCRTSEFLPVEAAREEPDELRTGRVITMLCFNQVFLSQRCALPPAAAPASSVVVVVDEPLGNPSALARIPLRVQRGARRGPAAALTPGALVRAARPLQERAVRLQLRCEVPRRDSARMLQLQHLPHEAALLPHRRDQVRAAAPSPSRRRGGCRHRCVAERRPTGGRGLCSGSGGGKQSCLRTKR